MKMEAMILYVIGILLGLVAIVLSFTGIPGGYDTEPVLAAGLIVVALGGIVSLRD